MASKMQWHPGFCAGMELEFKRFQVEIEREHKLTKAPLSIDLLIIRKLNDGTIDNELGNIFRKHNIWEMKSPDDELSIDVFYKVQAYACLYKASGEKTNSIPADDITVSLYRDEYPRKMISLLRKAGSEITQQYPGVYYVSGNALFPTQIVVSGELNSELHAALKVLTRRVREEDIRAFATIAKGYTDQADRERVDAILQISSTANRDVYEDLYRRDKAMCATLMEIMKEDIDKKVQQGTDQGREETAQLLNYLWEHGQGEKAKKAEKDKNYLQRLLSEFKKTEPAIG